MKKVLPSLVRYGMCCAISACALSVIAPRAFAQSSATVVIQGSISAAGTITATAAQTLSDADLTSGVTAKEISTVNERCNKHNGYTVVLTSDNAANASKPQAFMKGAIAANTDTINYTILYAGTAVVLDDSGAATVTSADKKTSKAGVDKALAVTVAASDVAQDTYADTLTLTLRAK